MKLRYEVVEKKSACGLANKLVAEISVDEMNRAQKRSASEKNLWSLDIRCDTPTKLGIDGWSKKDYWQNKRIRAEIS